MTDNDDERYPRYPHLENLDRVPEVLNAPYLYLSEKIHGFNARFGRTADGEFWVGSRNHTIDLTKDALQGFTAWALEREETQVAPGFTFFGEWAGKGIQKGIDYGERTFYLFAVQHDGVFLHPDMTAGWAHTLNCKMAPFIGAGSGFSLEALSEIRLERSLIAEQNREGIVIVPWPPMENQYGHKIIAKFKAPDFAERAHQRREERPPVDLTTVQGFVNDYATDERLSHVMTLLEESNVPPLAVTSTGDLLRTYYEDVVREGRDDFDALSEADQKMVGKVLNGVVKPLIEARRQAALEAITT